MSQDLIRREIFHCNKCGLCLSSCPVSKELLLEKFTPRGKIQLARFYENGQLEPRNSFQQVFSECLLCSACQQTCPSGVKLSQVFLAIRQELFSRLGPHPALKTALEGLDAFHNIVGEENAEREEWIEDLDSFINQAKEKGSAQVVYFVGCVSSFFPMVQGIPRNVVQILEACQVDFALLGGREWCCGYPLIGSGAEGFERFREHNLEIIHGLGARQIIFSCPSCLQTFKEHYNSQLRLLHITEFLAELLNSGGLSLAPYQGVVTYHDPCDLGRGCGVFEAPRSILKGIPGLQLKELTNNKAKSVCCGGGGNLEMTDPALSRLIGLRKAQEALTTGAEILVTACQQCVRTIKGAVRRHGIQLDVMDITDLVVRALDIEPGGLTTQ